MYSEQWIYRGTSWDVPLMLFFDHYYFKETRFSGIEVIWKAGIIEKKRQNRKKKKKETSYKRPEKWLIDWYNSFKTTHEKQMN